jgi:hypothetical protein
MNVEDGTELPVRHGNTPSDLEAGPDNSVGDDAALVEEDNGSMSEVAL